MQNRIIFITGRKGTGKTTVANALARQAYLAGRRVMIVAPMGGFDLPGAPTVYDKNGVLSDKTENRSFVLNASNDADALLVIEYAYMVGNVLLVIDEIDLYADVRAPQPLILQIIRYGRHRAVSLVGISQRPANVVRDMTAQSDYMIMFQSTELRDVAYLADRIGPTDAERVRALPQFQYLTYSAFDGGIIPVRLSNLTI